MPDRAIRAVPDPDDFSDLYEKLEEDAPPRRDLGPWRPLDEGPGAEVKGRVVAAREVDGDYGPRPVITVETPKGDITIWGFTLSAESEARGAPTQARLKDPDPVRRPADEYRRSAVPQVLSGGRSGAPRAAWGELG